MLFRHLKIYKIVQQRVQKPLWNVISPGSLSEWFEKSSNALIHGCFAYEPSASSKTAASDASWESSQSGSHATIYPREQLISHKTVPNYASVFESWGSEQGWDSLKELSAFDYSVWMLQHHLILPSYQLLRKIKWENEFHPKASKLF